MAALHIRDISDTLLKDLKVHAAECGLTLKQYVVGKLAMPVGGSNGEGNGNRAMEFERGEAVGARGGRKTAVIGRSAESGGVAAEGGGDRPRIFSESAGIEFDGAEPRRAGPNNERDHVGSSGDRLQTRNVTPSAEMPTAPTPKKISRTCAHGKPKGHNCGLCRGLAKVED